MTQTSETDKQLDTIVNRVVARHGSRWRGFSHPVHKNEILFSAIEAGLDEATVRAYIAKRAKEQAVAALTLLRDVLMTPTPNIKGPRI